MGGVNQICSDWLEKGVWNSHLPNSKKYNLNFSIIKFNFVSSYLVNPNVRTNQPLQGRGLF